MDRMLVVLVGGLANGYSGKDVRLGRPGTWSRLLASRFPETFARPEEIRTIKDIEAALRAEMDERLPQPQDQPINFLPVKYDGQFTVGPLSRRSPDVLAQQINEQIARKYAALSHAGGPVRLVLLTFSAGAILARRAMVLGLNEGTKTVGAAARPWPEAVETVVILSGITKGWQFTTATPAPLRFVGQAIRFLVPFDLLIWKLYRGAPFVVDTRLAYTEAFSADTSDRQPDREVHRKPPRTVFFLGSRDEYVTPSDCLELHPDADPVYLEIPHTNHISMLTDAGKPGGLVPRLIGEAIAPQRDGEGKIQPSDEWMHHAANLSDIDDYLDPLDLQDDHMPDQDVDHVVIVMHGIRDDGFWAKRVSREIKTLYRARHPGETTRRLRTVTPSYGFFSMWDFLFPGGRTRALYWFLDKYADIRSLYPRAGKIDMIAHSNGTYLGAQALRDCQQVRFRRMLFAGSVVRRDFWMHPIPRLPERLEAFHSFIGREDLVVALLPGALETIPVLNDWLNVGAAGAFGFQRLPTLDAPLDGRIKGPSWTQSLGFGSAECRSVGEWPHQASQRMIRGGHGAAIQEDCWKAIADFVIDDRSMDEILGSVSSTHQNHPLGQVSRGSLTSLVLNLLRFISGAVMVPLLFFLLLFPLWYPTLVLADRVPAITLPVLGGFPMLVPALLYLVLFILVSVLRNGLRYL
ncbi:hypothetical protein KBY77_10385 [Synechococcus sp. Cruz-7E5]|nr:hypothetical protein [Synechococcus sp. Cruz-7E5]